VNFLDLCKRLRQEAGISGTGPSTVLGQTGEYGKVVDWVKRAYLDIQNMPVNWDFMWAQYSFETTESSPGVFLRDYSLTGVRDIDSASALLYPTGNESDYGRLTPLLYPRWRLGVNAPESQVETGRPTMFMRLPDGKFRLHPKPDAFYTINFDYYREPGELVDNTDTPILPEPFHLTIVYKALLDYGRFENATEQYSAAQLDYTKLMDDLKARHIRDVVAWHRPLV
jgi:hypothetical protein